MFIIFTIIIFIILIILYYYTSFQYIERLEIDTPTKVYEEDIVKYTCSVPNTKINIKTKTLSGYIPDSDNKIDIQFEKGTRKEINDVTGDTDNVSEDDFKCECNDPNQEIKDESCQCKPGYQSKINTGGKVYECVQCELGSYKSDISNSSKCRDASTGYHVPNVASREQTKCSTGTYQDKTGQSVCIPAAKGYHVPLEASTVETECSIGTYQNEKGKAGCKPAEAGNYVPFPKSTGQTECPIGKYQPLSGQSECIPAQQGHHVPQKGSNIDTACNAGTFSGKGASSCTDCATGTYSSAGQSECLVPGQDQKIILDTAERATGVENCPAGETGDSAAGSAKTECKVCPTGTYRTSELPGCWDPPAGSKIILDTAGRAIGVGKCSAGNMGTENPPWPLNSRFTSPAKTECIACPTGTYRTSTMTQCSNPPAGSKIILDTAGRATGVGKCSAGNMGTENPPWPLNSRFTSPAKTECIACPTGTYRTSTMTQCSNPPAGHKVDATATGVEACPAGTYADDLECKECPAGKYQDNVGQTACITHTNCSTKGNTDIYSQWVLEKAGSKTYDTVCRCPKGNWIDGQDCKMCGSADGKAQRFGQAFNGTYGKTANAKGCTQVPLGYKVSNTQLNTLHRGGRAIESCHVSNGKSGTANSHSKTYGHSSLADRWTCGEFGESSGFRAYSNVWANQAVGTGHARSMIDSAQAWSASATGNSNYGVYNGTHMVIDLQYNRHVIGIVTQGRADAGQWVKKFKVEYKVDGGKYWYYIPHDNYVANFGLPTTGANGIRDYLHGRNANLWASDAKEFTGNSDQNTKKYNLFNTPTSWGHGGEGVRARWILIRPTEIHGHMSMRADALIRQPVSTQTQHAHGVYTDGSELLYLE